MKTYRLFNDRERPGDYRMENMYSRLVLCADFVDEFLGSIPTYVNVTISPEPFQGSNGAMFYRGYAEHGSCGRVQIDGEQRRHPIYVSPERILKRLTRNTGGKFYFKIEEAK